VRFEAGWFLSHPKAMEMTDALMRSWLGLVAALVYRESPDGSFSLGDLPAFYTARGRRRVTEADVEVFLDLALIEQVEAVPGGFRVRKWAEWSPADATQAYRLRRWRERQASEHVGTDLERLRALAGDPPSWESSS
jgi:hypothetical protein